LLFAPCEKALVDQNNNISLISVLEELHIDIPEAVDVPTKAVGVIHWDVVALWAPTTDDDAKLYEQRVEVVAPNGMVIAGGNVTFEMRTGRNHRNTVRITGFPVGPPGDYVLKLSIREDRDGMLFHEVATYPLRVKREKLTAD
jgi:hypothetical protein